MLLLYSSVFVGKMRTIYATILKSESEDNDSNLVLPSGQVSGIVASVLVSRNESWWFES